MSTPGQAGCRWCGSTVGDVVLDLGDQPAVDRWSLPGGPPAPTAPLQLWCCAECGLAQLAAGAPALEEETAVEPAAVTEHGRAEVSRMVAAGLMAPGQTVVEFASPHGGSWSAPLAQAGLVPVAGVADVVVDNVGLMHAEDLRAATRARVRAMTEHGRLVLVFPPLDALVATGAWFGVRHAHFTYPSVAVAIATVAASGLRVVDLSVAPLWGGTVTLVAERDRGQGHAVPVPADVDPARLRSLSSRVDTEVAALQRYLGSAAASGRRVLGYGAASRAVPLLGAAGIGPDLLPAIADAAVGKQGRLVPAGGIPVISPEDLVRAVPDEVVLFLPDLLDEVRRALPQVERAGGRWVDVQELMGSGPS